VAVGLSGFRSKYQLGDRVEYVDYSTRELQETLTPGQVLQILRDGNERFRTGRRLTRDLGRQVAGTAGGQHPLAVVFSCIDSRTPVELILDVGVGDVLSIRVAGNVTSRRVLGSVEYGCAVAGARLVLVLGHTRCGAVTAAVELACSPGSSVAGCEHLDTIIRDIQESVGPVDGRWTDPGAAGEKAAVVDSVARRNVARVVEQISRESQTLARLIRDGRVAVVGAMYDVSTGAIEFLPDTVGAELPPGESTTPLGRAGV
jgi:carbonic anhydrase/SulP family sulfate permease